MATDDYKEHLASVSEYRGLLALDKCIGELSAMGAIAEPAPVVDAELPQDIGAKVQHALTGVELETGGQPGSTADSIPPASGERSAVESATEKATAATLIAPSEMEQVQPETAPVLVTVPMTVPEPVAAIALAAPAESVTPVVSSATMATAVPDASQGQVAVTASVGEVANAPITASDAAAIVAEGHVATPAPEGFAFAPPMTTEPNATQPVAATTPAASEGAERAA